MMFAAAADPSIRPEKVRPIELVLKIRYFLNHNYQYHVEIFESR